MVNMNMPRHCRQQGVSLIEVLIAMVILAIGLLGLVGLQGRLHVTQVESYQRAQALILLQDMANRIALNRNDALGYVTADPIGTDMPGGCPVVNVTRTERDIGEWCQFLIGASETLGGESVGAMVGGPGSGSVSTASIGMAKASPEGVTGTRCAGAAADSAPRRLGSMRDASPAAGRPSRSKVEAILRRMRRSTSAL